MTEGRIGSGGWLGLVGSGIGGLALFDKGDPKYLDILGQHFDLTSEFSQFFIGDAFELKPNAVRFFSGGLGDTDNGALAYPSPFPLLHDDVARWLRRLEFHVGIP